MHATWYLSNYDERKNENVKFFWGAGALLRCVFDSVEPFFWAFNLFRFFFLFNFKVLDFIVHHMINSFWKMSAIY